MEIICYDNRGVEQHLNVGDTYTVKGTWKYGYYIEKDGKLLSFKSHRFKQEKPKPAAKKVTLFEKVFKDLK